MNKKLLIALFLGSISFGQGQQLYINELIASNENISVNGENIFEDWIELYNGTGSPVNLNGYYLSDTRGNLKKHKVETSLIVPAGGYYVFYADSNPGAGHKHLNFGLSAGGEAVYLTLPDGLTLIDSVVFPAQKPDVSYGRKTNGDPEWRFISPPSPGQANVLANSYLGILDPPVFSQSGGYYANPFQLLLSDTQGGGVYYTLDGSEPNTAHLSPQGYSYKNNYDGNPGWSLIPLSFQTRLFSTGINVYDKSSDPNVFSNISSTISSGTPSYAPQYLLKKAMVVKARSVKAGYLSSSVVSHTYFIGNSGMSRHTLPVISLSTSGKNLFDYYQGIYVAGFDYEAGVAQGANFRRGTEYPMSFEYFKNSNREFGMNLGFRIHGSASRLYPMKSMRLYARDEFGQGRFNYKFFSYSDLTDFKRIMLRNTGNDYSYGAVMPAMMRDAVMHKAARNLNVGVQDYQPAVIYLNGEYWGMEYIRERQDNYFLEQHYGVDRDNLDMIENFVEVDEGDLIDYNSLHQFFINSSMTVPSNYQYVKTQMDIENFIDYQATEIFFKNNDWVFNNISMWRERVEYTPEAPKYRDGKWRWLLYDLDYGLSDPHNNLLSVAASQQIWFKSLLKNPEFQRDFINRFADLMNSTFLPARIKGLIQEAKDLIEPEISNQIARWENINSKTEWENNVQLLKDFADIRPVVQRNHIVSEFALNGTFPMMVDVSETNAGKVQVNTILLSGETDGLAEQPYPWKGVYFDNVSVNLVARPSLGYKFDHWEVMGQSFTDSVLTILRTDSVYIKAFFAEDFLSSNPFPLANEVANCGYSFMAWDAASTAGTYPENMAFVYMEDEDPGIESTVAGFTTGAYNLSSRTRINGLGGEGISFINTGSDNPGYQGAKLGGALLALNTTGLQNLEIKFTAGTVTANSREYNLQLMYRQGDKLPFTNLLDGGGNPVKYERSAINGHEEDFSVSLPQELLNKPYIQLLWKYYYTGVQNDSGSGARDELRLDNIQLISKAELEETLAGEVFELINQDYIEGSVEVTENSEVLLQSRKSIIINPNTLIKDSVFKAEIFNCL